MVCCNVANSIFLLIYYCLFAFPIKKNTTKGFIMLNCPCPYIHISICVCVCVCVCMFTVVDVHSFSFFFFFFTTAAWFISGQDCGDLGHFKVRWVCSYHNQYCMFERLVLSDLTAPCLSILWFTKETAMTNVDLHCPMGSLLLHSWDDRFSVFLVLRHTDSVCFCSGLTAYRC